MSLLSFVVYGDEVKNITGALCGKNASSAQVRSIKISFILVLFGFIDCLQQFLSCVEQHLKKGILNV